MSPMHPKPDIRGEPKDSIKLRAAELMGKHYGVFTDRIEFVVPEHSAAEIQINWRRNCSSIFGGSISPLATTFQS